MTYIAILTSGGDAPGMNSAIQAVVRVAASQDLDVIGILDGYDGLIDGTSRPLTRRTDDGLCVPVSDVDNAGRLGGTILGSSRCPRFHDQRFRAQAAEHLRSHDVIGLIVVGGNGSMAGAHAIANEMEIPVVGIPASIDNDIGLTREALGVDTALNTIVEACDRISDTARSHRRAFIVEVMGRDSGYLAMAAAAALAADAVLLPEVSKTFDETVDAVTDCIRHSFSSTRQKRRILVIKAEGVGIPTHMLVDEVVAQLEDIENLEVRGTVLGHLVRGGNSSFRDRLIAGRFGLTAMEALLDGKTDVMVGWNATDIGEETSDSFIRLVQIADVLEETQALMDRSSPVITGRVERMENIQGVLSL